MIHFERHPGVRRAMAMLLALAAGCRDASAPPEPAGPSPEEPQFVISSPVVRGPRTVAYVSIAPGTFLDGRAAVLTNRRTGERRTEALAGGGMDPVALDALEGDTIALGLDTGGGRQVRLAQAVPGSASLAVVRTEPAPGGQGVPLASRVLIVFSEPLDPSSVAGSTMVLQDGLTPVRGASELRTDALVATFTPAGDLLAATDYTIYIGTDVRGASGARPAAALAVRFRTTPDLPAPPDTFPPVPAGARTYDRTAPHTYPAGAVSRYVLHEDSTFALQYLKVPHGLGEYTGRMLPDGAGFLLRFDANAGQWQATATLRGDSLVVAYNMDMALSDFEDGVYRLAPHEPWLPPDSDMLAFARGGDIWVAGDDGAAPRRLTSGEDWDSGPVWSPDGERLAFTRTQDDATPASRTGVWVIGRDGSGRVRLSAGAVGTHDAGPSWSPDGTRIAFHRESAETGGDPYYQRKFEIYVMRADGSEPVRLTHHRSLSYGAAWSPDGRRIAYLHWDYQRFEWTIRAVNADGTDDRFVTVGGMSTPSWSPDGGRLLFAGSVCRTAAGDCEWGRSYLFVVDADGARRERVTDSPFHEYTPAWSPDGGRIAFVAERPCDASSCTSPIHVLRLADRAVTTLEGTLGAFGPSWRPATQAPSAAPLPALTLSQEAP